MARRHVLTARGWAWVSTGLAGATTTVYVAVIAAEGNNTLWDVFPWVMLMLTGTGAVATAAVVRDGRVRRAFALAGAVVLAVTGLVGVFSVGAGLLLAAIAAGLATGEQQHVRVSGVGKSTVAQELARVLDLELVEGDDFHPAANITKMSAGIALTDDDRWPWLESLAAWTAEQDRLGVSTVATCSALRRAYRDVLRRPAPHTFFVHLTGSKELLQRRMEAREHFMPVSLLQSQFDTLEPLEPDESGVAADVAAPVDEVVRQVLAALPDRPR